MARMPKPEHVTIIGGGLFPRTALVVSKLVPDAKLTIVDAVTDHVAVARRWLNGKAAYTVEFYSPTTARQITETSDLVVFPLSFRGAREDIYTRPPAQRVVVHDWVWRKRGSSAVVSWLLLKRMNLVRQ